MFGVAICIGAVCVQLVVTNIVLSKILKELNAIRQGLENARAE